MGSGVEGHAQNIRPDTVRKLGGASQGQVAKSGGAVFTACGSQPSRYQARPALQS